MKGPSASLKDTVNVSRISLEMLCSLMTRYRWPGFVVLHCRKYSQGPEFSAILVNTTMKTESPLENKIHLRKWNFNKKVIFVYQ